MKCHHFITQRLLVALDQANRDFFFSGWLHISTVSTFLHIHVSLGFRPGGAMNCARDFSQSETEKYFDRIIIIVFISRRFFVIAIQWIFIAFIA